MQVCSVCGTSGWGYESEPPEIYPLFPTNWTISSTDRIEWIAKAMDWGPRTIHGESGSWNLQLARNKRPWLVPRNLKDQQRTLSCLAMFTDLRCSYNRDPEPMQRITRYDTLPAQKSGAGDNNYREEMQRGFRDWAAYFSHRSPAIEDR